MVKTHRVMLFGIFLTILALAVVDSDGSLLSNVIYVGGVGVILVGLCILYERTSSPRGRE